MEMKQNLWRNQDLNPVSETQLASRFLESSVRKGELNSLFIDPQNFLLKKIVTYESHPAKKTSSFHSSLAYH